jgi:hypothetical protein
LARMYFNMPKMTGVRIQNPAQAGKPAPGDGRPGPSGAKQGRPPEAGRSMGVMFEPGDGICLEGYQSEAIRFHQQDAGGHRAWA